MKASEVFGDIESDDEAPLITLLPKKEGLGFQLKKNKKRSRLARSDNESEKEVQESGPRKTRRGRGRPKKKAGRPRKVEVESVRVPVVVEKVKKVGLPRKVGVESVSSVVETDMVESRKPKRKSKIGKKSSIGSELEQDGDELEISRLDVFEYNEEDLVDYKKGRKGDRRKRAKSDKKDGVVDLRNEEKGDREEEDISICSLDTLNEKVKVYRKKRTAVEGDSVVVAGIEQTSEGSEEAVVPGGADENGSQPAGSSIGKRTRSCVKVNKNLDNMSPAIMAEKNDSVKPLSAKKIKQNSVRRVKKDATLHQGSENIDTYSSGKKERNKEKATSATEDCSSLKKVRKVNPEKQRIRDQIKGMVEDAGWTIDYRPRRDKEYNDAVYIDHVGTGYWSVLKAYYALQKQCENKETYQMYYGGTGFSFTPIPTEVLDRLTRLTKRKLERENITESKPEKRTKKVKGTSKNKSTDRKQVKKSKGSSMTGGKLSLHIRHGKSLKAKINKGDFNRRRKNFVKRPTSTQQSDNVGNEVPKNKSRRGYTLLVRKADKEVTSDGNQFIAYPGKRTVLSWLIDSGTVSLGGKVKYMNKRGKRALLKGKIIRDGINCGCCNEVVTISEFETHAGSKLCQPYQNIFVESGIPLFQCQIDAWNKQEESQRSGFHNIDISSDDPNDDTCGICGDGGDLICCDGCPSTFHQSCVDIQVLPKGDWHCFNCCCKFCGSAGCCDGQEDGATISKLLTCSLCEKKYHGSCTVPIHSDSSCTSFCGLQCRELFEQLQKLLGVKHELEAGFSWTVIQRSNIESDTSVRELPQKVECNSRLAPALSIMEECFLTTIDERSGINLIHNVIYNCGSNFNRLNYSGFYTYILERGDEMISVASIRIHGTKFAEMPFIGTRHIYRRQGMCRRLLNAIESSLGSLNVEKLIIPAVAELMDTWTLNFGFTPLEESYRRNLRSLNMVVFPGIALLQKLLVKSNSVQVTLTDGSVLKSSEMERNDHISAEVVDSDACSMKPDNLDSAVSVVHHIHGVVNELIVAKTSMQAHDGLLQGNSDKLCSNSQSQHPSISETESFVPEEEEDPTKNCSFELELQTSIEGGVDDAQNFNTQIDAVEPDLQSLAKTSPDSSHVLKVGLDSHVPEGRPQGYNLQSLNESSVPITQTKPLLTEVEDEPQLPDVSCVSTFDTKSLFIQVVDNPLEKSHVRSSAQELVKGAVNDVQELSMINDATTFVPHSLADTSVKQTAEVRIESLNLCSPKGGIEFLNSLLDNASLIAAVPPMTVHKHALSSSAVPNTQGCIEGAILDAEEVNLNIPVVDSEMQVLAEKSAQLTTVVSVRNDSKFNLNSSHQNVVGIERKTLEVTFAKSDATCFQETTNDTSEEGMKQYEVKLMVGACENEAVSNHQTNGSVLKADFKRYDHVTVKPINLKVAVVQDANGIVDPVVIAKLGDQPPDSLVPAVNIASNLSCVPGELAIYIPRDEALCCDSQSQHETISEAQFLLPDAEENSPVNSSVKYNLLDSIEGAVNGTEDGSGCYDFRAQKPFSTTEKNSILFIVENEPLKSSNVDTNDLDSIEGAPERNLSVVGVGSDLHSLADSSMQQTADEFHFPNEETEHCTTQSWDTSILSSETEFEQPLVENKSAKFLAKSFLQAYVGGVDHDAQKLNLKIDGVEPDLQHSAEISRYNSNTAFENVGVTESKSLQSSLSESDKTHSKEDTCGVRNEDMKHFDAVFSLAKFENEKFIDLKIDTTKTQDAANCLGSRNVISFDIADGKQLHSTGSKCSVEKRLEIRDVQFLLKTENHSNASEGGEVICKDKDDVADGKSSPRPLGGDLLGCTSEVVGKYFCAAVKINGTSVEGKDHDFLSNSCNSSDSAVLCGSDDSWIPFPGDSDLQSRADRSCREEVSLDLNCHVHSQASHCRSTTNGPTSELLHNVPCSLCITTENVLTRSKCIATHSAEPDLVTFGDGDGQHISSFKDKIDLNQANVADFDEDSVHETS